MYKSKKIFLSILFLSLFVSSHTYVFSQNTAKSVLITYEKYNSGVKHLYGDLRNLLPRNGYRGSKIEISSYDKLPANALTTYDAVILAQFGKKNLAPSILPFVTKNKNNPKLIITTFTSRSELSATGNFPVGLSAISSASQENPAKKTLIEKILPKLVAVLQ